MKRLKQSHWIVAVLAVVAGTSGADVRKSVVEPVRSPGERDSVSPACKAFLELPAGSTSELLPWDQRLSLAGCRPLVAPMAVSDPDQFPAMVAGLEGSVAPQIAIYRDAIAHGPNQIKLVAGYGLGMTYVNVMVRARRSVKVADDGGKYGGTTYGSLRYLDRLGSLHRTLEPMLAADRDAALAAFDNVAHLADQDPVAVSANDVVRGAVAGSRTQAELLRHP